MSTSDQQGPLTRKQLRELRRTGSTPVVGAEESAEESANSADTPGVQEPALPAVPPVPPLPVVAAVPVEQPAAPVAPSAEDETAHSDEAPHAESDGSGAPLTRRQVRERERIKTASVPVLGDEDDDADADEQVDVAPVSAAAAAEAPLVFEPVAEETATDVPPAEVDAVEVDAVEAVAELGIEVPADDQGEVDSADDLLADAGERASTDIEDERPVVSSAFGQGVLADAAPAAPVAPSFDELLSAGDSAGSHTASNTLIFTPAPGDGALDGPVASTGEILVTGSYELPQGLGSQGHANGIADGKEVDAVLIDGELPPASSPTPIAASAAVSTIKPAGEVIRPPAPEKGNKLMLTLAIVAGGLALALGVVLVIAFTTNVL